ncbi:MAG TPA: hypothetical protein VF369_02720 [candidate division Zixibacteria bacterium]
MRAFYSVLSVQFTDRFGRMNLIGTNKALAADCGPWTAVVI